MLFKRYTREHFRSSHFPDGTVRDGMESRLHNPCVNVVKKSDMPNVAMKRRTSIVCGHAELLEVRACFGGDHMYSVPGNTCSDSEGMRESEYLL
jgi:hypothetical protein